VVNTVTGESTIFALDTLGEHRGKYLLYGTASRHGITIAAGMREVAARPSCFVFMGDERAMDVKTLVSKLNGVPVVIVIGGYMGVVAGRSSASVPVGSSQYPVLNAGPLYGDPALERGYQQGYKDKNSMMAKAARLVDVWYEWEATKRLPSWCKTKATTNGLLLPRNGRLND